MKQIIITVTNFVVILSILVGSPAFIIIGFTNSLSDVCSESSNTCKPFMLLMAFISVTMLLGLLTRAFIYRFPTLCRYKHKLYKGSALALKLDYVLGPIEIAKDIYLDKRIKSVSKSIYYGALVI